MSLNNPPSPVHTPDLFSSAFHDFPDLSLHRPTTPVHSEPDQANMSTMADPSPSQAQTENTHSHPRPKPRTIIRLLSTKFTPQRAHNPTAHLPPPPPPSASSKEQRDAALRAVGLLPPLRPNKDLSQQEMEQDQHIPVVPIPQSAVTAPVPSSSSDPASTSNTEPQPSAADLIKKEWVSKNQPTSSSSSSSSNVESAQLNRLSTFKFGGSPPLSASPKTSASPNSLVVPPLSLSSTPREPAPLKVGSSSHVSSDQLDDTTTGTSTNPPTSTPDPSSVPDADVAFSREITPNEVSSTSPPSPPSLASASPAMQIPIPTSTQVSDESPVSVSAPTQAQAPANMIPLPPSRKASSSSLRSAAPSSPPPNRDLPPLPPLPLLQTQTQSPTIPELELAPSLTKLEAVPFAVSVADITPQSDCISGSGIPSGEIETETETGSGGMMTQMPDGEEMRIVEAERQNMESGMSTPRPRPTAGAVEAEAGAEADQVPPPSVSDHLPQPPVSLLVPAIDIDTAPTNMSTETDKEKEKEAVMEDSESGGAAAAVDDSRKPPILVVPVVQVEESSVSGEKEAVAVAGVEASGSGVVEGSEEPPALIPIPIKIPTIEIEASSPHTAARDEEQGKDEDKAPVDPNFAVDPDVDVVQIEDAKDATLPPLPESGTLARVVEEEGEEEEPVVVAASDLSSPSISVSSIKTPSLDSSSLTTTTTATTTTTTTTSDSSSLTDASPTPTHNALNDVHHQHSPLLLPPGKLGSLLVKTNGAERVVPSVVVVGSVDGLEGGVVGEAEAELYRRFSEEELDVVIEDEDEGEGNGEEVVEKADGEEKEKEKEGEEGKLKLKAANEEAERKVEREGERDNGITTPQNKIPEPQHPSISAQPMSAPPTSLSFQVQAFQAFSAETDHDGVAATTATATATRTTSPAPAAAASVKKSLMDRRKTLNPFHFKRSQTVGPTSTLPSSSTSQPTAAENTSPTTTTGTKIASTPTPPEPKRRLTVGASFSNIRRSVVGTLSSRSKSAGAQTKSSDHHHDHANAHANATRNGKPRGRTFDASHLPPSPTIPSSFIGSFGSRGSGAPSSSSSSGGANSGAFGGSGMKLTPPPTPTRLARPVVIHTGGSILEQAQGIEDDETRRMTELAFM